MISQLSLLQRERVVRSVVVADVQARHGIRLVMAALLEGVVLDRRHVLRGAGEARPVGDLADLGVGCAWLDLEQRLLSKRREACLIASSLAGF